MRRAFIVEGHTEAGIINSLCKGAEVRRLRINGVNFPIPKIVDRIYPQISLLYSSVDIIYIIVDREGRKISGDQMKTDTLKELIKRNVNMGKINVCVPDRCIESWFAAFLDNDLIIKDRQTRSTEGEYGKSIVKALFKAQKRSYNEQVDGLRFFKVVVPSELCKVSSSFNELYQAIDSECWWKKSNLT